MSEGKTYVIGTDDSEIARLGVQHRVWRPSVLELWRLAGVTHGMRVMDCGSGPGYAALDLAEIVGPEGHVLAVERSRHFLDSLADMACARGLANIACAESDLLDYEWPAESVDRIWCRWVLAFVSDPGKVVHGMARALKPGGKAILHEYYDYASWHLAPRSKVFESYVARIIARWRAASGEPDIALALPPMLHDAGLQIELARPVVFAAKMNDFASRWPMGFARSFLPTLHASGDVSQMEAREIEGLLSTYESDSRALVITPGVLQFIATKP